MKTLPEFSEFVATISAKDFETWSKEINDDNGPFITSMKRDELAKTAFKLLGSSGVLTLKILARYHEWLESNLTD
jgi:hypothetical protein